MNSVVWGFDKFSLPRTVFVGDLQFLHRSCSCMLELFELCHHHINKSPKPIASAWVCLHFFCFEIDQPTYVCMLCYVMFLWCISRRSTFRFAFTSIQQLRSLIFFLCVSLVLHVFVSALCNLCLHKNTFALNELGKNLRTNYFFFFGFENKQSKIHSKVPMNG